MTTSTTSIDILGLQAAYANLHTDQERDYFFFFSSRRRHTRWNCDWSSDVCSSVLGLLEQAGVVEGDRGMCGEGGEQRHLRAVVRSEERRVGKECRYRWST